MLYRIVLTLHYHPRFIMYCLQWILTYTSGLIDRFLSILAASRFPRQVPPAFRQVNTLSISVLLLIRGFYHKNPCRVSEFLNIQFVLSIVISVYSYVFVLLLKERHLISAKSSNGEMKQPTLSRKLAKLKPTPIFNIFQHRIVMPYVMEWRKTPLFGVSWFQKPVQRARPHSAELITCEVTIILLNIFLTIKLYFLF